MLNRFAPKIAHKKNRRSNSTTGQFFGMQESARTGAWWMIAAFVCALASAPAAAQNASGPYASASPPSNPTDAANPQAESPLTPDEATALGNALIFDPANLATTAPARSLRLPNMAEPGKFDVNRTDKPDGSSTTAVKQLLTTEWDANVGADLNTTPDGYQPRRPLSVPAGNQDSGAAWASIGVPNLASVDARVDPTYDKGKLGGTLKHSIPVGSQYSVTLQNTYSVTETYNLAATGPSDIPMMVVPAGTLPTPQVWGDERVAKFNILPTGTTLGAGQMTASNDPVTHHTLSAEQQLYGPLHVTTAVTDFGQPTASKSITAGFKLNW
jgi:hypothetical protein